VPDLTPTYDNSGGIRTEGGPLERYFSTITNLKQGFGKRRSTPLDTMQSCSNSDEETAPGVR